MKCIGVMTSGGDAPGMNAAIRAVARTAAYHGVACKGIRSAYQGMMDGDVIPLGPRDVSGIIDRGGSILKAGRCKGFLQVEGRAKAAETLRREGIDGLVVVGGDGSYHGAQALHAEHGIAVIGLPGTIDNDIGGTDVTIGFDTAMNTAMNAIDKIRDTARSHDRIFLVEVMGRHSGYIAMIAGLAGGAEQILIPEHHTEISDLAANLRHARELGKLSMIICVAEGDDAGSAEEVRAKLKATSDFDDLRVTVLGHLQRGGSPTAMDRVLASRTAVRAVEALLAGETGMMVGQQRGEIVLRPLSDAWEQRVPFSPDLVHVEEVLRS